MPDSQPQSEIPKLDGICIAWCIALVALVLVVFHPVLHGEFLLWDDDVNISNNPHLNGLGAAQLKWMFTDTSYLWRYQPFSWLTWAAIKEFYGLNPFYFHLAVLLFHAVNSALVFLLVRELLFAAARVPRENPPPGLTACAGLGAMLWAIHPLRGETTATAVNLAYVQPLFFFLLSLLYYVRAASAGRQHPRRDRLLSLGFFLLSLLSYPIAMFGFMVFIALDFFPLRRLSLAPAQWRDKLQLIVWREKIPFVLVSLFCVWINVQARTHQSVNFDRPPTLAEFGIMPRVMRAFYMWAWYVWKPWWPFHLTPLHTAQLYFEPFALPFVLSALLVIGLTVLLWMRRVRWPWAFAAWLCHLALLMPMLGLSDRIYGPADRYSLAVGVGWAALLAGWFWKLWPRLETRRALLTAMVVVAPVLALMSYRHLSVWRTNIGFFQEILRLEGPRLGTLRDPIYRRLSKAYVNAHQYAAAIDILQKMIQVSPDNADLRVRLGEAFRAAGDFEAAKASYNDALRINPADLWAKNALGAVLGQQGQLDLAAAQFADVLRQNPHPGDSLEIMALQNMAMVMKLQGKTAEAQNYLNQLRALHVDAQTQ